MTDDGVHLAESQWGPAFEPAGLSSDEEAICLTVGEYEAVGGLKEALSLHADELFENVAQVAPALGGVDVLYLSNNQPFDPATRKAITDYIDSGKGVILGVRPEDIGAHLAAKGQDNPRISARVEVVEPMGSESYVYYRVGKAAVVTTWAGFSSLKLA